MDAVVVVVCCSSSCYCRSNYSSYYSHVVAVIVVAAAGVVVRYLFMEQHELIEDDVINISASLRSNKLTMLTVNVIS